MAGLHKRMAVKQKVEQAGQAMQVENLEHIEKQLAVFKENLEGFARKHKNEINKSPQFRRQFQKMCGKVGVDPLASNKGIWAQLLGVGDFYYELSVQVIDVCLATRPQNGGLIAMDELCARLAQKRGSKSQSISSDDVLQAIKKVSVLGNGFKVVDVGRQQMVVSVPCELNRDHTIVLEAAQASLGYVTAVLIRERLGWDSQRLEAVLDLMRQEGMVWVDLQNGGEPAYWFPSLLLSAS